VNNLAFLSDLRGSSPRSLRLKPSVSFWENERIYFSPTFFLNQHTLNLVLRPKMIRQNTTEQIIGAAIKIHRRLGPGLLEPAYEVCLAHELQAAGLQVQRQKAVPLVYEAVKLECGFRADLVVNRQVVIEIKCKEALHPVDQAQILSYLRLLDLHVGLLINFHVAVLKDGIRRVVNDYHDFSEDDSMAELQSL
jgi:GxxExxY protein